MAYKNRRVQRARELRQAMTPAELVLWRELRGRRFADFKFRRQHPLGPYVVDYFCPAANLIVELDGETHFGREQRDNSSTKTGTMRLRRASIFERAGL